MQNTRPGLISLLVAIAAFFAATAQASVSPTVAFPHASAISRASALASAATQAAAALPESAVAKKKATVPKKTTVPVKKATATKTTAKKTSTAAKKPTTKKATTTKKTSTAKRATSRAAVSRSRSRRARARYSPWAVPTYADSVSNDIPDGDDPVVRKAAVEALGRYNGAVVVANADTGRILSVVNQKTAIEGAYIPCSVVKVPVALTAMSEGMIDASTMLNVARRTRMDLTVALAKSNNVYFERVGGQLGFEKLAAYHRQWGLGEKTGLNIPNENPGVLPEAPPKNGGAARMSSFGEGISITALQVTALLSAVANGGTLFYLQYPKTVEEIDTFVPRVKRYLDIEPFLSDLKRGMSGAVNFGTARQAAYVPEAPIYGKTGTCTDYPQKTHMGWFGSFIEKGDTRLVVTVVLTGADGVSGPRASGIAGKVYQGLDEAGYFQKPLQFSPVALIENPAYNLSN